MIKFNVKKFCQKTVTSKASFKNLSSLNQLILYVNGNFQNFTSIDFVNALKTFENLRQNEAEHKVKFYELSDFLFADEKNFTDSNFVRNLIEVYEKNQIKNEFYINYIVSQITKKNIKMLQNKENFSFFLEKFQLIGVENNFLWSVLEEAYLELKNGMNNEEILRTIKLFCKAKRGSSIFSNETILWLDNYCGLKNSDYFEILDLVLSGSVNLTKGGLNKFVNKSLELLTSKDTNINDIMQVFPQLHSESRNIEQDKRISQIKEVSLKLINQHIHTSSTTTLSLCLRRLSDLNYRGIDYEKVLSKFIKTFSENNVQTNINFLSYLSQFDKVDEIPDFLNIVEDDLFWEDFIESFYHLPLSEKISVLNLLIRFKVTYLRIFIILLTSIKNSLTSNPTSDLSVIEHLLHSINYCLSDESHPSSELIFKPFLYFLEKLREKLVIAKARECGGSLNKL